MSCSDYERVEATIVEAIERVAKTATTAAEVEALAAAVRTLVKNG